MAFIEDKFNKQLEVAKLKLEEIRKLSLSEHMEDISLAHDQIRALITTHEKSKEGTVEYLIESDKDLEYIKTWQTENKGAFQPFRDAHLDIKKKLDEFIRAEHQAQKINEEQTRLKLRQQKEIENAVMEQPQREEEWYLRKLDFEKQIGQSHAEHAKGADFGKPDKSSPQSVKLQKYTITPFNGDYKDSLRFWNQFSVEVEGSTISEISKFNYLLELVKGKPKDDILGLPHSEDGYKEAKRILEPTYGKDTKVQRALIKELEDLAGITSIHRLSNIHDFYNKQCLIKLLSRQRIKLPFVFCGVNHLDLKQKSINTSVTSLEPSAHELVLTMRFSEVQKKINCSPCSKAKLLHG